MYIECTNFTRSEGNEFSNPDSHPLQWPSLWGCQKVLLRSWESFVSFAWGWGTGADRQAHAIISGVCKSKIPCIDWTDHVTFPFGTDNTDICSMVTQWPLCVMCDIFLWTSMDMHTGVIKSWNVESWREPCNPKSWGRSTDLSWMPSNVQQKWALKGIWWHHFWHFAAQTLVKLRSEGSPQDTQNYTKLSKSEIMSIHIRTYDYIIYTMYI